MMDSTVSREARPEGKSDSFRRFAHHVSCLVGKPAAFFAALAIILVWVVTGPVFHYSDTWQLIINTGTTIVTFLMVFLIQATQNRDAAAIHLKLDELIRATGKARNALVALEQLPDAELAALEKEFERLRQKAERARKDDPSASLGLGKTPHLGVDREQASRASVGPGREG